MQQLNCAGSVLASLLFSFLLIPAFAQYGDYGTPMQPADTAAVDDIIYYGDYMDMSGGYQVGDTVYNFTAYDFDGNSIELYEELAGEKPVILVSGSVSCIRFRNVFDPNLPTQETFSARDFIYSHTDEYNWIFIYGVEAHPTDGNCPSNCPQTVNTDTAVVQPSIYAERRWAMHTWLNSPEHDFPFTMYADNTDNAIYNNFFQRPFGLIGLNCDGTVALRADWVTYYFSDPANVQDVLDLQFNYTTCSIDWTPLDDTGDDDTGDDDTGDDDTGDDDPAYDGPQAALGGTQAENEANAIAFAMAPAQRIFPNPARDVITAEGFGTVKLWQLVDLQGRSAATWNSLAERVTLPVAALPRGAYVLLGYDASGIQCRTQVLLD